MAMTERLAILITGDAKGAVNAFDSVGKAADKDLVKAEKSLDRVGARMQSMGTKAVAAGAVMAAGLYQAVLSTQDLADSWDKAEATFGTGDNGLVAYAEAGAEAMGKSKAAALDAASAYGLLFKGAGLDAPDLTKLSTDLAVRTADLAEQYKKPFEEANASIANAIKTGSSKALRGLLDYGIAISDTDVKTEALTIGVAKQGDVLTRQQKSLAVSSLIMKQSAAAAGTYRGSLDDVGVQIEVMRANWENAKASLGEAALPAFTELATKVSGIAEAFNGLSPSIKSGLSDLILMATTGALLGGALSTAAGTALRLKSAFGEAASGADKVSVATSAMTVAAVGWGYALTENARQGADALDALLPKIDEIRAALDPTNPNALTVQANMDARTLAGVAKPEPRTAGDKIEDFFGVYDNEGLFGIDSSQQETLLAQQEGILGRLGEAIKGLPAEEGRRVLDAYKASIEAVPGAAADAAKILDPLYADLANAEAIERATKSTTAYSDALASTAPGVADLASALEAAGVPIEKVDAVMAALDPTTAATTLTLEEFRAQAEAMGIPLDQLQAALDAAGVKVETFSSRFAAASAKVSQASSLVIGYERALIRQEKAQQNLDGLADKQASDLRSANDAVEDATDSVTDAIKRRTKAQQTLNDLNKKSAVAGSVPLLQEITRAAAEMETQAQAAARVAEATYGVGSDQAITANRAAADAGRRREQAGGFLNQALSEQQGRNAQERADAAEAVADADKAVSRASRDRADAEKRVDETIAGAATERKEAELDLIEATLGTVDAFGRLNAAVQDGLAPVDTLREGLKQAFDQGALTAEQFMTLSALLDQMATSAAAIVNPPTTTGPTTVAPGVVPGVDPYGYPVDANGNRQSGPPNPPGPGPIDAPSFTDILLGNTPVRKSSTTTTNNYSYNITATDPLQTAAEITKRNKLAILERKMGR